MIRRHSSHAVPHSLLVVIPLLLGVGGCVAAPAIGLATSGGGNASIASAMQHLIPAMAIAPCAGGATEATGCAGDAQHTAKANPEAMEQASACPQDTPTASRSDCNGSGSGSGSGMNMVMQGLAGSLQKLAPSGLLPH